MFTCLEGTRSHGRTHSAICCAMPINGYGRMGVRKRSLRRYRHLRMAIVRLVSWRPCCEAMRQADDGNRYSNNRGDRMRLGVFTALLSHLPLEDALATLKSLQIDTVELGTGNYPGDAHCKLSMLEDASALNEFQQKLRDDGMSISALSCHGNALHPQQALAEKAREVSRKTILLAEKLGVST